MRHFRLMRAFTASMLFGGLCLLGCGSSSDDPPPAPGVAGPSTTRSGGSRGSGSGGSGGSSTGTGGMAAAGSGGSSSGPASGGAAGGASAAGGTGGATVDAGKPADGAVASGDGLPAGLGPGSADDSPPLVLPGSRLIFDGKTLTGWMPCDPRFWSVKDGAIDGNGSGNNFCLTADDHDTFRITGKSRMVRDPSNHAGICIWGGRAPGGGGCLQMTPVSGSLWDYGGGNGVRTLPRSRDYSKWNFFEILVDLKTGAIDIAVEGQAFPRYMDRRLASRRKGPIGLQLHAGNNQVQYKDLALEDNPTVMRLLTAK